MVRSPMEALGWAVRESQRPSDDFYNKCLIFTRTCFDVPAKYASAAIAWEHAKFRHGAHTQVPAGVPVWWTGGSHGYGHVAISAGGGYCYSSDFVRKGKVDRVKISDITTGWGLDYKGWTEDINDVRVYTAPPKPVIPVVNATTVALAVRTRGTHPQAQLLKKAVAAEVGPKALRLGSLKLGFYFRRRYRAVQVKYLTETGQPVTKAAADGIPGADSLRWLGQRHGFKVS